MARFAKMNVRSLLLFGFPCLLMAACGNAPAANQPAAGKTTTVQWIDSALQMGRINEGQKLAVSFRFRNTGSSPLVITGVRPSCGCTVADFPREPIAPGSNSEITAEFNSEGREGLQHKVLTVNANTPGNGESYISFDVDVVKQSPSPQSGK